jgi:hypothetical protein
MPGILMVVGYLTRQTGLQNKQSHIKEYPLMTTETSAKTRAGTFTLAERRALRNLRTRYQQDSDLWSNRERAHLHFLRWLYRTGQLGEANCNSKTEQRLAQTRVPTAATRRTNRSCL